MPSAARLLCAPAFDHERPLTSSSQHERGAEPGGSATHHDAIPRRLHAIDCGEPTADRHRRLADRSLRTRDHLRPRPEVENAHGKRRRQRAEAVVSAHTAASRAESDCLHRGRLDTRTGRGASARQRPTQTPASPVVMQPFTTPTRGRAPLSPWRGTPPRTRLAPCLARNSGTRRAPCLQGSC